MKRKKRIAVICSLFLLTIVVLEIPQLVTESTAVTSYVANTLFKNNFHAVKPGQFYRSGEMSTDQLLKTVRNFQIKKVIDLRLGKGKPDNDGLLEEEALSLAGIDYVHLPFNGRRMPTLNQIHSLLDEYHHSDGPILVHCTSGTHRSGVASALWLIDQNGSTADEAAEQLSLRYGFFRAERHLKSFFSKSPTIDAILWQYMEDLKTTHTTFRSWAVKNLLETAVTG